MRIADVLQASATPLGGPAFPSGPYHFANREYLNITYRTDPTRCAPWCPNRWRSRTRSCGSR